MKIERGLPRLVKPADRSNAVPKVVPLSSSDLVVARVHVGVIYAYKASKGVSFDHVVQVLEGALGRVLTEYREWAGRLMIDETGRPAIELNDDGVVFVEAVADGCLQDVFPFDPSPLLQSMVPPSRGVPELLLVQVTKFKCGGLTLGVARYHQVADGTGASQFMNAWASACKGLPLSSIRHDRAALMPRDQPTPTFDHIEYVIPLPKPDAEVTSNNRPVATKKIRFSFDMVKKIQSKAVKENDERGFPTYSTFESLTGHLWRCITKARGLSGDIETRTTIICDVRRRLTPSISEDYYGNAIFRSCARTLVTQLTEEPLSYAAGVVHASIKRLDNDYIRSAIDYIEHRRQNTASFGRPLSTVLSPDLKVTSWLQMPLYKLDFGWGTPVYAGPSYVPFEGLIILNTSHTQDGSVDAILTLFEDDMAKFENICFEVPN
ncbi:agmatine hydroxycinnamoyltransferase 1 [Physcomitrium patens]|uniref:BAHD family acyltransferase, clade V n=1 Tax=Physcomitrium patens TaxID=3218 RepID=A0A2K1IM24_PHYPA|nr:agmatine hydroxycinnamoyltransferase 1-like [Physcomitrium patens]PNR30329.1 hypothetical protein PHYPA_026645 [Physcomitrium patens]|eukprot:XP_024360776.1 agmatine hydroxycinnamoyltransferase 1-like [Physcomitrella patens]